jgi:hypothetical protein
MNERIRELANKAVGKRSCYMIEAEYIKFAELIVQECADYVDAFNRENMVEEGIGGTKLKRHFEVE